MRTFVAMFLNDLRTSHYSPKTLKYYSKSLNLFTSFLAERFEIDHPRALTKEVLKAFIIHVNKELKRETDGEDVAASTKSHILNQTKIFLSFLSGREVVREDMSSLFEGIRYVRPLSRKYLSEKQVTFIFSKIDEEKYVGFRDKTIFETLYGTGIRMSEAMKLELYDVDFENSTLLIREGKGRKDRLVPFGLTVKQYLKTYIEDVRPVLLNENSFNNRLFVTFAGGPFNEGGFRALFYKYAQASGIGFSPHSLRHCFASHMLKNGANILYIQKILGHENLSTTQIYTKIQPLQLAEGIRGHHPRSALTEVIKLLETRLRPKRTKLFTRKRRSMGESNP